MNGCVYQTEDERCLKFSNGKSQSWCVGKGAPCGYRVPSNHDVITRMSAYDMADWICKILMYHGEMIRHIANGMGIECSTECPLYYCCNDQPTDTIEGWLNSPGDHLRDATKMVDKGE